MNGRLDALEQIGFLDAAEGRAVRLAAPQVKAVNDPEERTRRAARTIATISSRINASRAGEIVNRRQRQPHLRLRLRRGRLFSSGVNKIVPDIGAAFERLRNVARCRSAGAGMNTPCARPGAATTPPAAPDRQCGKVSSENEKDPGRICV